MGKRAKQVKQEDKTSPGFLLFGKKQAPLILAVLLIAAILVSFLMSLGTVKSSEPASSGETSEGQAVSADSSAGETSSEGGAVPANTTSESGENQFSGPSAASGDEYVLPAGSSQAEGQAASQEAASNVSSKSVQNTGPADFSSASQKNAAQPDDFSGSEISRQEYDSLQKNMTYEEAQAAIGGPGTLETGSDGKTKIYRWSGYGSSDSYAKLTFKSGKLTFKIQFGL